MKFRSGVGLDKCKTSFDCYCIGILCNFVKCYCNDVRCNFVRGKKQRKRLTQEKIDEMVNYVLI